MPLACNNQSVEGHHNGGLSPHLVSAHIGELAKAALSKILSMNWVESLTNQLPDCLFFSVLELVDADLYFLSCEASNIGY